MKIIKNIYKTNLFKRTISLSLIILMLMNCIITNAISLTNKTENENFISSSNTNEIINDGLNSQDIINDEPLQSTVNSQEFDTSELDTSVIEDDEKEEEKGQEGEEEEENKNKEDEPIVRDYEAAYADDSNSGTLVDMITLSITNNDKKEIILYQDVEITKQINLSTKDYLNLNLNSHTITRTNNEDMEDGRLFCVAESSTLILTDGTLNGGKSLSNGGSIYVNDGSTLHLNNITMINNKAKNGSAIYIGSNSNLTLENTTINGNNELINSEDDNIILFSKGTITLKGDNKIINGIVCVDNESQKNVMFKIDTTNEIEPFKITPINTPIILANSSNNNFFTPINDAYKIVNINNQLVLIKNDDEIQASYTLNSNDVINGSLEEMWKLTLLYGKGKVTLLKNLIGDIGSDDEVPATPKWINDFYQMSTGIDSNITFDFNGYTLDANMYELVQKAENLKVNRLLGTNFIFSINQGSTLTLTDSIGGGGIKNVISGLEYPSAINMSGTSIKKSHLIIDNINITDCVSGKGVIWSNNEYGDIKLSGNIIIKDNKAITSNDMINASISETNLNLFVDENAKIEANLSKDSEIYITTIKEREDNVITISRNTLEEIFKSEKEDFVFIVYNNTLKLVHISEIQPNDTSEPNPKYIVQFYANLPTLATSGTNALPLIDTSNKSMPTNKGNTSSSPTNNKLSSMYIDSDGNVEVEIMPTEIFKEREFEYYKAPTINYMNELVQNGDYILKEVWVLKEGRSPEGINPSAWYIYTYNENLHFTNRIVSAENKQYILIQNGTTLRLVYDTTNTNIDFKAEFYDYDISNGWIYRAKPPENQEPGYYQHKTTKDVFNGNNLTTSILTWAGGLSSWDKHLYTYTQEQGINSDENYSNNGVKLAFGNVNTGTNLGKLTWGNNELNKYNNKGYKGCTFGLVNKLNEDGKLIYTDGIDAPNLFNEGSASGKTSYINDEYSLKFNRDGDTYTLIAVNGTKTSNLNKFTNPSNSQGVYDGKHYDNNGKLIDAIWTNNFWPMDSADSYSTGTHDIKFGGTNTFKGGEHELRFGPITQKGSDYTFPESDDGLYHNSYFGMHYSVTFNLIEDYIGPLNYYFYGDDDMWVFLDGKLICDIGGIHSSVGEYVNLRDYLPNGSSGTHELQFFYTERGASGSTCWMQFTLPSVIIKTPELTDKDYGDLTISKTISQLSNDTTNLDDDEFDFTINLTDEDGNQLADDYAYSKYNKDGVEIGYNLVIWNGATFSLKNGEYIVIKYLPKNTKYNIIEINEKNSDENQPTKYYTDIIINGDLSNNNMNLTDNKLAIGNILNIDSNSVEYNNKTYFSLRTELPNTGSNSIIILQTIALSISLIGCILIVLANNKNKYIK